MNDKIRELKNDLQIESGIRPAYLDDLIAYILNNVDISTREDIPHIFGSGTPAQNIFSGIIAELLKI